MQDCLLDRAVNEHDRRLCSCGCGFWASESQDPENEGWFEADEVTCWARYELDKYRLEHKKPEPGVLVYARWSTADD